MAELFHRRQLIKRCFVFSSQLTVLDKHKNSILFKYPSILVSKLKDSTTLDSFKNRLPSVTTKLVSPPAHCDTQLGETSIHQIQIHTYEKGGTYRMLNLLLEAENSSVDKNANLNPNYNTRLTITLTNFWNIVAKFAHNKNIQNVNKMAWKIIQLCHSFDQSNI